MSDLRARRLLEASRRRTEDRKRIDYAELAFGPQKAFIEDESLMVAACTGRRAGKSEGIALKMLRTAHLMPRSYIPYITTTGPEAKRIMWPKLHEWNRRLDLNARFNQNELTMTLRNGSIIQLGGAKDQAEIERYRGIETPLAVVDEAQNFRAYLETLIEDILEPTGWGKGGQIVIAGTPNSSGVGYFARAVNPDHKEFQIGLDGLPAWSNHHWTALDSPFMREEVTVRWPIKMARLGVTESHPKIQREHYGRWVRDLSGLVYPIPDRCLIYEMPEGNWEWYLGGDYGSVNATALVVLAHDPDQRLTVVVKAWPVVDPIPSRVVAEISRLEETFDFRDEVFDPGGGGKGVIDELNQIYGSRIRAADKQKKRIYIELFNAEMRGGRILFLAPNCEPLLEEAAVYSNDTGQTLAGARAYSKDKLKFDDRLPHDHLDAMLYGWRAASRPNHMGNEREPPTRESPEWWAWEEERLLSKALREGQERAKGGRGQSFLDRFTP